MTFLSMYGQKQLTSIQKENEERSPSRVTDFDQFTSRSQPSPDQSTFIKINSSHKNVPLFRRKKNDWLCSLTFRTLATLEEVKECVVTPDQKIPGTPSPLKSRGYQQCHDRIQDIIQNAEKLASRGEEAEASLLYEKASADLGHLRRKLDRSLSHSKLHQPIHYRASLQFSIQQNIHSTNLLLGQVHVDSAKLYEWSGDFEKALLAYQNAVSVYKECCNEIASSQSKDIDFINHIILKQNLNFKRMQNALTISSDRHKIVVEIADLKSRCSLYPLEESSFMKEIEEKATTLIGIEMIYLGNDHPQVAAILRILAVLAYEQGNSKQALELAEGALDINFKTLGPTHPITGHDYLEIAKNYNFTHQWKNANLYLQKALKVFREIDDNMVGTILNDIAVTHIMCEEYESAIKMLKEVLSLYETNEDKIQRITDTIKVLHTIADCLYHLKDFGNTVSSLTKAFGLQKMARKRYDTVGSCAIPIRSAGELIDDLSLADTLRRLGDTYLAMGSKGESLDIYKQAMTLQRTAVAQSKYLGDWDHLLEGQDELAHTLYCIADVYNSVSECDGAQRIYEESLRLGIESDENRSENKNLIHSAKCLIGIAKINFKNGECFESFKLFEQALSYCEKQGLLSTDSFTQSIREALNEVKDTIMHLSSKNVEIIKLEKKLAEEKALGFRESSIKIIKRLIEVRQNIIEQMREVNLNTTEELRQFVELYHTLGHCLLAIGDKAGSTEAHKFAISLYRNFRRLSNSKFR